MNTNTQSPRRRKIVRGIVPVLAMVGSIAGVSAGDALAFTPGTGCGTGTGSSAGITAEAHFVALPPCSGYIRVVDTCQASSGATQVQYGSVKTYPNSSSKTCGGSYNFKLKSWGWQVSSTS